MPSYCSSLMTQSKGTPLAQKGRAEVFVRAFPLVLLRNQHQGHCSCHGDVVNYNTNSDASVFFDSLQLGFRKQLSSLETMDYKTNPACLPPQAWIMVILASRGL